MAVSFNFANAGPGTSTSATMATLSNTAGGVTFTLTGNAAGGPELLSFGNASFASNILLSDKGSDDIITLTFASMANPANTQLTANSSNPIQLSWTNVTGTWTVKFQIAAGGTISPTGSQYTITNSEDNQNLTFNALGISVTGIVFTSTNGAPSADLALSSLSANALNCFTKGTGIATPTGRVAVQDLREGDMVLTADGRETPVRWLGVQPVDTRLMHPAKVNPIRIIAGALGNGLPERDLLISPDHAIAIDGMLINAGALVNGSTIYQEPKMPMDGFTYYHVETEAHELLLAEGVAAETFIDYAGRDSFENGGESTAHIPEMDLPRISSPRLVPAHIRTRLTPAIAAE